MDPQIYSTNQLYLRSDRIGFGSAKHSGVEEINIITDFNSSKVYYGLSSIVSTSKYNFINTFYPENAAYVFDLLNKRLAIGGISTPQYSIDISSSTGIRVLGGGSFTGDARGLVSVPTAALFSTLPSYVFSPQTIPLLSLQHNG